MAILNVKALSTDQPSLLNYLRRSSFSRELLQGI